MLLVRNTTTYSRQNGAGRQADQGDETRRDETTEEARAFLYVRNAFDPFPFTIDTFLL